MNIKQKAVFILFSAFVLALIYKILPNAIPPLVGLLVMYYIISRQEVKDKARIKIKNIRAKIKEKKAISKE